MTLSQGQSFSSLNIDSVPEFVPRHQSSHQPPLAMEPPPPYSDVDPSSSLILDNGIGAPGPSSSSSSSSSVSSSRRFRPRFEFLIEDYHDIIIQSEDETCFYYNSKRLIKYSTFFEDMDSLPEPVMSEARDATDQRKEPPQPAAVNIGQVWIKIDEDDPPKPILKIIPFMSISAVTTEILLFLMGNVFCPPFKYYDLYYPDFDRVVLDVLSAADYFDMRQIPALLAHSVSEPFLGYAIAGVDNDDELAIRLSKRLVDKPCEPEKIPPCARKLLEVHAPDYLKHLAALQGRRQGCWKLFYQELRTGRLDVPRIHNRGNCKKHAVNKPKGLDGSDYAQLRTTMVDTIEKKPWLLNGSKSDIGELRQIVCNVVECGYEPCIDPLKRLLMYAQRKYWVPMPDEIHPEGYDLPLEGFLEELQVDSEDEFSDGDDSLDEEDNAFLEYLGWGDGGYNDDDVYDDTDLWDDEMAEGLDDDELLEAIAMGTNWEQDDGTW